MSAALRLLVSMARGAVVKIRWPALDPHTILAVPPSDDIAHDDTLGVNSALGLPMPRPARTPDASRYPDSTFPVSGTERATIPYVIDDVKSACDDSRRIPDIVE